MSTPFKFTKKTFNPEVRKEEVKDLFFDIFHNLHEKLRLKYKPVAAAGTRKMGGNYLREAVFMPDNFQKALRSIKNKDLKKSSQSEAKYFISIDEDCNELSAGLIIENYDIDGAKQANSNYSWQRFSDKYSDKGVLYGGLSDLVKKNKFRLYCRIEDSTNDLEDIEIDDVKSATGLDYLTAFEEFFPVTNEYGLIQIYKSLSKYNVLKHANIARELTEKIYIPLWQNIYANIYYNALRMMKAREKYRYRPSIQSKQHHLYKKMANYYEKKDGMFRPLQLEEYEAREGDRQKKEVDQIKRDPKLVRLKKGKSDFRCEACGFSFENKYGAIGKGYIIIHHIDPLGPRKGGTNTSLDDLLSLCSNCHSMIHRTKPPLSLPALKRIINKNDN